MRPTSLFHAFLLTLAVTSLVLHPEVSLGGEARTEAEAIAVSDAARRSTTGIKDVERLTDEGKIVFQGTTGRLVWDTSEMEDGNDMRIAITVTDSSGTHEFVHYGEPYSRGSTIYEFYRTDALCKSPVYVVSLATPTTIEEPRTIYEWLFMKPDTSDVASVGKGWPDEAGYGPQSVDELKVLYDFNCDGNVLSVRES